MKRLIEKHGKRTLAFLLTALMVISLLPVVVLAEEGKTDKFVPDTAAPWHTRASVTMDDGTIITVEGTDNGAVLGPDVTLSVKDIAASGTFAVNHGELDSGYLAYEISILDKDGKLLNDSAGNYWLTIENRFIKDDWNLMSSSSGALENVKQASASNGSICIPNNQWNGLIPTNGSAITVMAGKMEPLSDTFLSKVGPYSIDFILRNYNAFVSGDYDGSHVSGPVVVGGSACNTQLGGINNTDPEKLIVSVETIKSYKHTIPSYIGTMNEGATRQILTNNINVPLYLGPEEVGNKWAVQYDQWNAKDNDNYWYTSEFVDWDIAMANIQTEADKIADNPLNVKVNLDAPTTNEGYSVSGGKLKLDGGNTYELTAAQLAKLGDNGIYFNDGYSGDPVVIVVKDEKSVTIPKCDFAYMVDSTNRIDFYTEAMVNLNIVWVLPDAENVSALELTGHIVAPKATVTLTGGQFEGCIIAKTLNASGTEGHHWTLGRSLPSIPSVTVQPVVKKVVTGTNAPDDDVFTFTIKAGEKTELPDYYNKSATAKAGEEAKFDEITYYEEGKFTYIITEDTPREKTPGMEYSDEVITMTVNVTKNGSKLDVNVTYSNDDISNDFPQNVITNHYYKTTAQPVVKKVVTGSGAPDDEVYTFSIKATGDTKLPTDYKTKVTAKDGEEAKFDEITYYEEGTYTYEIKEEAPDTKIFGMQYSEEVVKVTVEVKKNLETDELEAEITYTNPDATGTDKNVITNNFAITDYDIWVQKIVISVTYGVDAPDNKQFTFELTAHPDTPDAPLPSDAVNGAMEITVTDNAVDHFGRIYYTEAGEYKYIIKELVPRDAATNYFGFAFDDTEHVITVKVEENDKKELVVTSVTGVKDIDYKGEKVPGVSFTNEYDPVVDLEVELTKFVTGPARTSDKPAVFTFTMKAEGDAPMPASAQNGEVTITMTDSQVARFTEVISFPAMTYIEATHPGQIWVYTVTENVGSDDGFTYDEKEYRVEVTVDKATNNPYFLETFVKLFEVDNSGATPRFTPVREITFTNTYTEEEESSGGGESSSTPGGEESSGGGESSSTPGGDSSGSSESSSTSGGGGSSSGSGSSGKDGPQTGDNSSVTLWVILMMLSCAGIYIVSFIRKMKRFEGQ